MPPTNQKGINMRTYGDDKITIVGLKHKGNTYSGIWFYGVISKKESVKRAKKHHSLTGKHNVIVNIETK